MTQSAASRQIQALEDELGVRLFARIGRSARLTSEGEDLLMRSRRLLFDAEALGQRASALKTGEVGVLRVGATPQVIENLLADFLSRYRKRHPGVEVHLVEDGGSRLPGRLERGDIDVAHMPAGDARFSSRSLHPMHVLAVLPRGPHLTSAYAPGTEPGAYDKADVSRSEPPSGSDACQHGCTLRWRQRKAPPKRGWFNRSSWRPRAHCLLATMPGAIMATDPAPRVMVWPPSASELQARNCISHCAGPFERTGPI